MAASRLRLRRRARQSGSTVIVMEGQENHQLLDWTSSWLGATQPMAGAEKESIQHPFTKGRLSILLSNRFMQGTFNYELQKNNGKYAWELVNTNEIVRAGDR